MRGKIALHALVAIAYGLFIGQAQAAFTIENDGYRLTFLDQGRPVLVYQYGTAPSSGEEKEAEAAASPTSYIHPLYGLMGEQVTGDSPSLWAGPPGIRWGWASCVAGGKLLDVWNRQGGRRVFERVKDSYADDTNAELALQNGWVLDATGQAKVLEDVFIRVHSATGELRPIDLHVAFKNVSTDAVYLRGSKAQSGLAVRLNLDRDDWTFTAGSGRVRVGEGPILSPWMDCSYRDDRHSTYSGLTIMQHSDNPGFTSPNWTITPEGVVTAGVAGEHRFELGPGESLLFRYRILLHRGFGPSMNLMREYVKWMKPPAEPEEEPPRRLK